MIDRRAAVAAVVAGLLTAALPAKADMAAIGIGLGQLGCAAVAYSETVSVYHQDPEAGIDLYYATFWSCMSGG